jgi:hypothetical protein
VLTPHRPTCHLTAETAAQSTITQIYEGTNQVQRMVMAQGTHAALLAAAGAYARLSQAQFAQATEEVA